jgi:hypothetical protein
MSRDGVRFISPFPTENDCQKASRSSSHPKRSPYRHQCCSIKLLIYNDRTVVTTTNVFCYKILKQKSAQGPKHSHFFGFPARPVPPQHFRGFKISVGQPHSQERFPHPAPAPAPKGNPYDIIHDFILESFTVTPILLCIWREKTRQRFVAAHSAVSEDDVFSVTRHHHVPLQRFYAQRKSVGICGSSMRRR